MSSATPPLRAVIFDYGNTLIEFSRRHVDACDAALAEFVGGLCGSYDEELFHKVREEHRMRPYSNNFEESSMEWLGRDLVLRLAGRDAVASELCALLEKRFDAFVGCIEAEPSTLRVLAELRQKYRLGLLSNYPCGRSIRGSLERTGIARHLDAIVVSGEIGWVKPHPLAFERVLAALDVRPEEALFVGDNWLADVQGAKRAGLRCFHMRRWVPPEHFEAQPGDHEPDAEIYELEELLARIG
jgi:putative hydrolase of the HAD superfamily